MIYISSACVKAKMIKEAVERLAKKGFTNIELSGGTEYYEGIEDDLIELKESYNLNYSVHNYFPPPREEFVLNLIADNNGLKSKSGKLVKEAVALSKKLGTDLYTVHAGYTRNLIPRRTGMYFTEGTTVRLKSKNKLDALYESLEVLMENVIGKKFRIGIENLFPISADENYSLLCSPDEIIQFLSHYKDRKNIGLLFDFGHFNVASHYLGFDRVEGADKIFRLFSEKIFEIHLSDNDGRGDFHRITRPDSWQVEFLRARKRQLKGVPVVFEWFDAAGENDYERYRKITEILEG